MNIGGITPEALYQRMAAGEPVDVIDVRSPREYQAAHVPGARLLPLNTLTREAVQNGRSSHGDSPVYLICWSGARSAAACARLAGQGLNNVVNVEGGTRAWQQAGLPVEGSGASTAARWFRWGGLLAVVATVVLGSTVHSAFLYAAVGIWLALIVTGNAPCCASGACSTGRGR